MSEVSLSVISKKDFGFKTGGEEDMNDDIIAMEEDTWTVWFDQVLDDLDGPSAPIALLELGRALRKENVGAYQL